MSGPIESAANTRTSEEIMVWCRGEDNAAGLMRRMADILDQRTYVEEGHTIRPRINAIMYEHDDEWNTHSMTVFITPRQELIKNQ